MAILGICGYGTILVLAIIEASTVDPPSPVVALKISIDIWVGAPFAKPAQTNMRSYAYRWRGFQYGLASVIMHSYGNVLSVCTVAARNAQHMPQPLQTRSARLRQGSMH